MRQKLSALSGRAAGEPTWRLFWEMSSNDDDFTYQRLCKSTEHHAGFSDLERRVSSDDAASDIL
jgi:hypothetical protein